MYRIIGIDTGTNDGKMILLYQSAFRVYKYILPSFEEIILMIQLLLLRSVYRFYDDNDDDDDDTSADVQEEDNTIAGYSITTNDGELILLFRLAYRVDRM